MADAGAETDVVNILSRLIQFDTSNHGGGDGNERPAAEYVARLLDECGISATILESAPGRSNVVARIEGTEPGGALLVHGHLDVVPAQASDWSVAPFSGEVDDQPGGCVWGRGALDMKNMDAMILAVVRQWTRENRRPRRDIVLAFTADEEDSAAYGSDWLVREHADRFEGCTEGISESGGGTFHAGNGVRLYPIAAGERGTAWLDLIATGTAGHGSRVNRDNAVSALAAAIARIADHEWPVRLTPTVRASLEAIAAAVGTEADLDAPGFDVDDLLERLGPARQLVESTVRNSANPTMLNAGYKVNVIPGSAGARVDGRVVPGGIAEFESTMDELTGDRVSWSYHHTEQPLSAPADSATFAAMSDAVLAHDPDAHVMPFCMGGGTDAKQFARLGIAGYGFVPMRLPVGFDPQPMIHGVDERVPVDALKFGVQVLDQFLSTVASGVSGGV